MREKQLQLEGLHRGRGNIRSSYSLITDDGPGGSGMNLLCAAFDGQYQSGATSADDGRYMLGCLRIALNRWPSRGLVLDLAGLSYVSGNGMDKLLTLDRTPPWLYSRLEIMVIISPLNDRGLCAMAKTMRLEKSKPLLAADKREAVAGLVEKIERHPIVSRRDQRS